MRLPWQRTPSVDLFGGGDVDVDEPDLEARLCLFVVVRCDPHPATRDPDVGGWPREGACHLGWYVREAEAVQHAAELWGAGPDEELRAAPFNRLTGYVRRSWGPLE
jgi:hypothetical protein